jgi:hypothetical protein
MPGTALGGDILVRNNLLDRLSLNNITNANCRVLRWRYHLADEV